MGRSGRLSGVYLSACKITLAPHAAKANEKWLIKSFRPRPLRERPLTHKVSHEICLVCSHVTKHIKKWSLVRSFTDVKVGKETRYRFLGELPLRYKLCAETKWSVQRSDCQYVRRRRAAINSCCRLVGSVRSDPFRIAYINCRR